MVGAPDTAFPRLNNISFLAAAVPAFLLTLAWMFFEGLCRSLRVPVRRLDRSIRRSQLLGVWP
jgi:hypothetical protein